MVVEPEKRTLPLSEIEYDTLWVPGGRSSGASKSLEVELPSRVCTFPSMVTVTT